MKLFPHRLMSQMSQKDSRSCYFMGRSSMDFQKVNYKNVKKKQSFHNKHIYIYGHRHFEVL